MMMLIILLLWLKYCLHTSSADSKPVARCFPPAATRISSAAAKCTAAATSTNS